MAARSKAPLDGPTGSRAVWLQKLRKLNPNRSRTKGAAPHKPCLLLSLLDMAQDGELLEQELRMALGLYVRFNAFSSLALPRWGGKVHLTYPFFHLSSQDFWIPMDDSGHPAASVEATRTAFLDPVLLALMHDADFRRSARMILVETYFPPAERVALYALLGVRAQSVDVEDFVKTGPAAGSGLRLLERDRIPASLPI